MRNLGTAVAVVLTVAASSASAQSVFTLTVGLGGQYAHITDAVAVANSDSDLGNYYVVNLAPGTYINDFPTVLRPMTIQVDPAFAPQRAKLQATVPLPNQKGIILTFSSLTVRGLVFIGAQISNDLGGNGAGIRDQNPDNTPASLVVDNSAFHDNQEGILQCCDAQETITITNSRFRNNGTSDPDFFQHGIYINEAANLTVANSLFCGQLIGHDIKSRAAQTVVVGSQIYTGEGRRCGPDAVPAMPVSISKPQTAELWWSREIRWCRARQRRTTRSSPTEPRRSLTPITASASRRTALSARPARSAYTIRLAFRSCSTAIRSPALVSS